MHPYQSKSTASDNRLRGEPGGSLRLRHLNKFLVIFIIILLTFNTSFCFAANEEIGSAEAIIQRLANSKTDKTRSALIWGGIGLGYSSLSLLIPVKSYDLGWGSLNSAEFVKVIYGILGAAFIAFAGIEYFSPTGIGSDYEKIKIMELRSTQDIQKRNDESEISLKNRANEAEKQRIGRSLILLVVSLSCFPIGETLTTTGGINTIIGTFLFGGLGIYDWLTKTEIENEAERYFNQSNNDS